MELLPFFLIAGFIGIALVFVIVHHLNEKKRREKIGQIAATMGLPYFEKGDPALLTELSDFELFSKGRGRTISNMIHGEADGVDLGLFDYRYTVGGGKNSQTHRQSVVYIKAQDLKSPVFMLGPEHFFHRIGNFLGMQDIDFDEYPNFSAKFLLRGPDETAIREFFTAERLTFLEGHTTISIEGRGPQLAVFYGGKRADPENLQTLMSLGFEIYALFREEG